MQKIAFTDENGLVCEYYVNAETVIDGYSYLLLTDEDDGEEEADALIVKRKLDEDELKEQDAVSENMDETVSDAAADREEGGDAADSGDGGNGGDAGNEDMVSYETVEDEAELERAIEAFRQELGDVDFEVS